ncbi:MAG TPA: glycosyl transferase, partial [Rhodopila sp.]
IGGIAEAVRDDVNGLHVPVSDAVALAATMRRAIEQPGLWERLRNGIQPPVSVAQAAAGHYALYDRLVAGAVTGLAA